MTPSSLHLALIGPGNVGQAFLDLLRPLVTHPRPGMPDLFLEAVCNSRWMWLGADNPRLFERVRGTQVCHTPDMETLARYLLQHCPGHGRVVVVDCSADDQVVDQYGVFLSRGMSIVTANKRGPSGPLSRWRHLQDTALAYHARLLYETTVGAGLPVLTTVADMRRTGDGVLSVAGMMSGSLGWLLNTFDGHRPFSGLVREARENGLTEPDPRDDLSGMDVARKLVILAREAGLDVELEDVEVQSLVPPSLRDVPLEVFDSRMTELDRDMAFELMEARGHGALRHVGRLDVQTGKMTVGLEVVDKHHPFAHAHLTDNVFRIKTVRYDHNPLIVQGPGAGAVVTAAGVLADVLRCG